MLMFPHSSFSHSQTASCSIGDELEPRNCKVVIKKLADVKRMEHQNASTLDLTLAGDFSLVVLGFSVVPPFHIVCQTKEEVK